MNYTHAIVKKPGKSYVKGLTTSDLGIPDYNLAIEQHNSYIEALRKCNVEVIVLESDEKFPDSTFVEDTAVLTKEFAIVANPGAKSRNGEKFDMIPELKRHYKNIHYIDTPGTLDGGDVLQADDKFYIGISERTNETGAKQFVNTVEDYGYEGTIVPFEEFFHLKTGVAYIGNNKMVVAGEFINHPDFESYEKIIVQDDEEYAANCIMLNDYVIIPAGFGNVKSTLTKHGIEIIEVEMSEFQKQDGGLSCLSLRFEKE